jgi:hypothetical protein
MCMNKEFVKNCKRRCASKLRGMVSVSRVFDALIFWTVRRLKSRLASFCCMSPGKTRIGFVINYELFPIGTMET